MAFKMKAGSEGPMKKNFSSAFKKDKPKKGWDSLTPEEQEEQIKLRKSLKFNEKIYKWKTLKGRHTNLISKGVIPTQGRKI